MLIYFKNVEAMIQDDITRNPPRIHPSLVKGSEFAPAYLAESQPLAWTSLLDITRLSEIPHLHVKMADLSAGNNSIHIAIVVADIASSANWVSNHTVDVIEPIALRAPEVILGARWGPSAEIWGLGCVVS
jgi:hypothetical protein